MNYLFFAEFRKINSSVGYEKITDFDNRSWKQITNFDKSVEKKKKFEFHQTIPQRNRNFCKNTIEIENFVNWSRGESLRILSNYRGGGGDIVPSSRLRGKIVEFNRSRNMQFFCSIKIRKFVIMIFCLPLH